MTATQKRRYVKVQSLERNHRLTFFLQEKHGKTPEYISDFKKLDEMAKQARHVVELLKQGFTEVSAQHELIKAAITKAAGAEAIDVQVRLTGHFSKLCLFLMITLKRSIPKMTTKE